MFLLQQGFASSFNSTFSGVPAGAASAAVKKKELLNKLAGDKEAAEWVQGFMDDMWIESGPGLDDVMPNPELLKDGSGEVFDFNKVTNMLLQRVNDDPMTRASSMVSAVDFLGKAFKTGPEVISAITKAADDVRTSRVKGNIEDILMNSKLAQSLDVTQNKVASKGTAQPTPTTVSTPPQTASSEGGSVPGVEPTAPITEVPIGTPAGAPAQAPTPASGAKGSLVTPGFEDFRNRLLLAGALSSGVTGQTLDVPGMFPDSVDQVIGTVLEEQVRMGLISGEDAKSFAVQYRTSGAAVTNIHTGDLTKPVITDLQKNLIKTVGTIGQLDSIIAEFNPAWLSLTAKGARTVRDWRSSLQGVPGVELDDAAKAEHRLQSFWLSQLDTIFVDKRKELTGVAFGPAELQQYYDIFPSTHSGPDKVMGQLYALKAAEQANQKRLLVFIESGKVDMATMQRAAQGDAEARATVGALMDSDRLTNYGFNPDFYREEQGITTAPADTKVDPTAIQNQVNNILDEAKKLNQ